MIPNFNIKREDILHTEDIFAPNIGSIKVKATKHVLITWTQVPREIVEKYGDVTPVIDKYKLQYCRTDI